MSVASLELCKELYELSGWEDTGLWWTTKNPTAGYETGDPDIDKPRIRTVPKYSLGYLLRKLPLFAKNQNDGLLLFPFVNGSWRAGYEGHHGSRDILLDADTPEDAACKLAIELFKQKVLKRDAEENVA